MNDADIRKELHTFLETENKKFRDTIIIDELDLCSGLSRVDIAVINGSIHGFEIKSEEDTLNRLPNQINYYNKSLEKVTLVTNPSHLNKIKEIIPDWWGLILADSDDDKLSINQLKKSETNLEIDAKSILELLWKDELIDLANNYDVPVKKSFSKSLLREAITEVVDTAKLTYEVRSTLKFRKNWRS